MPFHSIYSFLLIPDRAVKLYRPFVNNEPDILAYGRASTRRTASRSALGMTLIETVFAMGLSVFVFIAVITGYNMSTRRAEWSAYSLAAQALALQGIEQVRACQWDLQNPNSVQGDELQSTNFPVMVNVLDVPVTCKTAGPYLGLFPMKTNQFAALLPTLASNKVEIIYATNFTTISNLSSAPYLKMVRVDCVWPFFSKLYTNTAVTFRAPTAQ
jgi:hypothetical protein